MYRSLTQMRFVVDAMHIFGSECKNKWLNRLSQHYCWNIEFKRSRILRFFYSVSLDSLILDWLLGEAEAVCAEIWGGWVSGGWRFSDVSRSWNRRVMAGASSIGRDGGLWATEGLFEGICERKRIIVFVNLSGEDVVEPVSAICCFSLSYIRGRRSYSNVSWVFEGFKYYMNEDAKGSS